jgi:hypothetical protein
VKSRLQESVLVLAILGLGLCLRIVPVLWGVPISPDVGRYHTDEAKAYQMTARGR